MTYSEYQDFYKRLNRLERKFKIIIEFKIIDYLFIIKTDTLFLSEEMSLKTDYEIFIGLLNQLENILLNAHKN